MGAPPPGESPVGLGDDGGREAIVPDVTKHEKEALEQLRKALDKALEDVFEAEEAVTAHSEEVEGRRSEVFLELQRLKSDSDTAEEKINRAARDIDRATRAFDDAEKAGVLISLGKARDRATSGARDRAVSDAPDRGKIRDALSTPGKWRERVQQAHKDIAAARAARAAASEAHFVAALAAEGRRPGAAAAAASAEERKGTGTGTGLDSSSGRGSMALTVPGTPSPPRKRRGRRASVVAFVPISERKSRLIEY